MSPKRTELVAVTVPPRAVSGSPCASRASTSQLHATSGSNGSAASEASTSAWMYATSRVVPCHASSPFGSYSRMRRPKASPSESSGTPSDSSCRTSAPSAKLCGASRCGGRIGATSISLRTVAAFIAATAARKRAGSGGVVTTSDVSAGDAVHAGGAPVPAGRVSVAAWASNRGPMNPTRPKNEDR